ncbi:MAG: DUF6088 family protein [Bacilli bacterium]
MKYSELLLSYISNCPLDEPIFIEDIKTYIKSKLELTGLELEKVFKSIYVYINRLIKKQDLEFYSKGIYYKPSIGAFGKKTLNKSKVIQKKYIENEDLIKGYVTGPTLYNYLGLTTQNPEKIYIVTNECPNKNQYENKLFNVIITKPKIEITKDNYLYLQLIDLINNKDDIPVENLTEKEAIFKYIKENELEMEKIFKYASLTNNKKAIDKLFYIVNTK